MKVRGMAPDYVNVHFQEAAALQKLNRIPEAVERLERQTTLDPVWDQAWERLAALYAEAGRAEKAVYAKQKAEEARTAWENAAAPGGAMPGKSGNQAGETGSQR